MLKGKNILLGITGGIAAYKAAELCRLFIKEGADVKVVMTPGACEFITPLTLQTLSGHQVYSDTFAVSQGYNINHISLTNWAEAMVIAPATANTIAKFAHGLADDLLTTTFLARGNVPTLIAPAMNSAMYENPMLQRNLKLLIEQGNYLIEPETGELACGVLGKGKMAAPSDIVNKLNLTFKKSADLAGLKVMVTAGPTKEPIDPVRFLSNHSSGKMGYALAQAARDRGAEVTLISGPTNLEPPNNIRFFSIETALEMYERVISMSNEMDIIIKAAAVADYRPKEVHSSKIKKSGTLHIELARNPDILKTLGEKKRKDQILVGFAAETDELLKNATDKLQKKNLDMIAANDITLPGAGFKSDTNTLKLLLADSSIEDIPMVTKKEAAHKIIDKIIEIKKTG